MYCKKCGQLNPEGSKFCESCGSRLETDRVEVKDAISQAPLMQNVSSPENTSAQVKKNKKKALPIVLALAAIVAAIVIGIAVFGLNRQETAENTTPVAEATPTEEAYEEIPVEEEESEIDEIDLLDEAEAAKANNEEELIAVEEEPDLLDEAEAEKANNPTPAPTVEPMDFTNVTTAGFETAPPGSWIQVLVDELDLMSKNTVGWDNFICYATKYRYYPILRSYYDAGMNMTWYQLGPELWTLSPDNWLNIHIE